MKFRDTACCGLFGSLALALPMLFHALGLAGAVFLPMFLPLALLAFLVRTRAAALTALVVPFASSVLTGMPLLWPPLAAVVALELVVQAVVIGVLRRRPYLALLVALPLGRALHAGMIYGLAQWFKLPAGVLAGASFLVGWPGVALMLAVVPPVVLAVRHGDATAEVRVLRTLRRLHLPEGFVRAAALLLRWFGTLVEDARTIALAAELRRPMKDVAAQSGDAPVLRFVNVTVAYPDAPHPHRVALDVPSFEIAPGEKVALLGPNGSGKTTLLLAAAGVLESAGEIVRPPRGRVGFLFENPDDQFLFPTVREDVAYGGGEDRVDAALASVGYPPPNCPHPHRDRRIASLSRGQRQRVALAGLLAAAPDLLLLDEPTAALDDAEKARLAATLAAFPAAALIATHDRAFAERCCTRFIHLEKGRLT